MSCWVAFEYGFEIAPNPTELDDDCCCSTGFVNKLVLLLDAPNWSGLLVDSNDWMAVGCEEPNVKDPVVLDVVVVLEEPNENGVVDSVDCDDLLVLKPKDDVVWAELEVPNWSVAFVSVLFEFVEPNPLAPNLNKDVSGTVAAACLFSLVVVLLVAFVVLLPLLLPNVEPPNLNVFLSVSVEPLILLNSDGVEAILLLLLVKEPNLNVLVDAVELISNIIKIILEIFWKSIETDGNNKIINCKIFFKYSNSIWNLIRSKSKSIKISIKL